MVQSVSDSELVLMRIVWSAGGRAQYAEIMEKLSQSGCAWRKNTVITLLSRLAEKGLLSASRLGRRNTYTALVSEADYQAAQTQALMNKLYAGSAKGLVATLIQRDLLSPEDYAELKRYWEDGER